jgi:hypothetical protein
MRYRRKPFGHIGFHHPSAAAAGLIDEHLQGIAPIASGETQNYWMHRRKSMSFVTTQPEMLAAAAAHLQSIGSAISVQNAAAAAPITGVVPAAADEVSALTAARFALHAQMYQAVSAQAAAIHQMFATTLGTSAGSYAATEAANVTAAR